MSLEGFLFKQGQVNKAFKKRYFRLKDAKLSYYGSEKDTTPLGVVELDSGIRMEDTTNDKFESGSALILSHSTRKIVHDHQNLVLASYSKKEMEKWKQQIGVTIGIVEDTPPVTPKASSTSSGRGGSGGWGDEDSWGSDRAKLNADRAALGLGTPGSKQQSSSDADGTAISQEQQVQMLKEDNKASLQRSLQLTSQMKQTGASTLAQLESQTEQIESIQDTVANIHGNMHRADRLMRGIESIAGSVKNKFTKNKADEVKEAHMSGGSASPRASGSNSNSGKYSPRGGRPAEPMQQQEYAPESEDASLDLISSALKDMKAMGVQMGQEVDYQAKLLDRLDTDVDAAASKIEDHNKRMKKILK
eukprot:TRINITY_DN3314_c0_g1::TRINITY_DN3314_c0_g1_i1::g.31020::m.31020 TRINITY_DN3314_c0_g1::TRINITY_DN3314_c0_g1_i1::g.31020  ORF type:complete len:361 (-),score=55.12,sp/P83351/SNA29_CAEEL/26.11/7e-11,SNARE/PF05739.14/0.11,SNARE/PF05739.14/5.6e-12,PH/PF00169.24/9.6e-09,V-SNARE_C/PF12352.3/3.5e-06,V-SNARE_C/PF12352.3/2.1e+02,PH_11/PF15413.1/8.7e-05,PH_11/PF15413.1/1.8e+03,PH_8/PF15409.1/0.034,PH_8/PF15409.1/3.6e+03,Sec20/PF03908.8/1.9e+03,Sec20/PF03908.8/0.012,Sec20/PF03908.8/5.1e+02,Peripla_BP_2/PF01